jgi:hypothetical protein
MTQAYDYAKKRKIEADIVEIIGSQVSVTSSAFTLPNPLNVGTVNASGNVVATGAISAGAGMVTTNLTANGNVNITGTTFLNGETTHGAPSKFQLGSASSAQFQIANASKDSMTFTNHATLSCRTDAGTAMTAYIQKNDGFVLLILEMGNIGTIALATSAQGMLFNEVLPARYRPAVNIVRIPTFVRDNGIDTAGHIRIFTSGGISIHPGNSTTGSAVFTNAANCGVNTSAITCYYRANDPTG